MIAVGDVVVEKLGDGKRMKVVAVNGDTITAKWVKPDNTATQRDFPADLLTLAPQRR